jgi:hypothetical protein
MRGARSVYDLLRDGTFEQPRFGNRTPFISRSSENDSENRKITPSVANERKLNDFLFNLSNVVSSLSHAQLPAESTVSPMQPPAPFADRPIPVATSESNWIHPNNFIERRDSECSCIYLAPSTSLFQPLKFSGKIFRFAILSQ